MHLCAHSFQTLVGISGNSFFILTFMITSWRNDPAPFLKDAAQESKIAMGFWEAAY
jgi:hypothetical protein